MHSISLSLKMFQKHPQRTLERYLDSYPCKNEYKTTGSSPTKCCTTFISEYCKWSLIRVMQNSVYIMQINVSDITLRFVIDTGSSDTIIQTTQDSFCQQDANHCSDYDAIHKLRNLSPSTTFYSKFDNGMTASDKIATSTFTLNCQKKIEGVRFVVPKS